MQRDDNAAGSRTVEERLDATAEAWHPDPGDKLVGQVVDVDSRTTEFGTYPIVTLVTDAGDEYTIHAFHTVLKNEFSKRQPKVGETIGIKYLGRQPKGYEGYRLVWEETLTPDWERIGAETAAEAAVEGVPSFDDIPF